MFETRSTEPDLFYSRILHNLQNHKYVDLMFKRRFDKALSEGLGSQLLWLLVAALLAFLLLWGLSCLIFPGWQFGWQDLIALYIDPGCFSGRGEHDWFRLSVALIGVLLFSTLLISVFNNLFDNIVEMVRTGHRRYALKNHILFLGAGKELIPVLKKHYASGDSRDIAIMTSGDIETLRSQLELKLEDNSFVKRLYLYQGDRDVRADLESACAGKASLIYIFGESGEQAHDSRSLACYDILKLVCKEDGVKANCYVSLESDASMDVILKLKESASTPNLKTDFVCSEDNTVEQLLVHQDFLPVIKRDDKAYAHIVILGTGTLSDRLCALASQLCHYPDYADGRQRRTLITVAGEGMRSWRDAFVASKRACFELSRYSYIGPDGQKEIHEPDPLYGDFLDVEWQFIDAAPGNPLLEKQMQIWNEESKAGGQELRLIICSDVQNDAERILLCLPPYMLDCRKAIYVSQNPALLKTAIASGQFGPILLFGPGTDTYDPLFEARAKAGMQVNSIYENHFSDNPRPPLEAWYSLREAHKFSSIYSSFAMPLRRSCFGDDCSERDLFECEHRRWMSTMLMSGYRALTPGEIARVRAEGRVKEEKDRFRHVDIVPYDDLPEEEKDKDRVLVEQLY